MCRYGEDDERSFNGLRESFRVDHGPTTEDDVNILHPPGKTCQHLGMQVRVPRDVTEMTEFGVAMRRDEFANNAEKVREVIISFGH